jgi:hypothetical protein
MVVVLNHEAIVFILEARVARERIPFEVKCPKCGNGGSGLATDSDAPFAGPDFDVKELPEGFEVTTPSVHMTKTVISCIGCGVVADWG